MERTIYIGSDVGCRMSDVGADVRAEVRADVQADEAIDVTAKSGIVDAGNKASLSSQSERD